jgi:hypothetical protein
MVSSVTASRRWYEPRPIQALRRRWHLAALAARGRRLIFIAGCARSGTSLLKQLMACFDDTSVFPRERPCWHFLEMADERESTLIVKRTADCHRDLHRLPACVDLVYCVRHPYDCLTSSHPETRETRLFHVTRQRWLDEDDAWLRLGRCQPSRRTALVRYEDLVRRPDDVQAALADALRLSIRLPFSRNAAGIEIHPGSLEKWRHQHPMQDYLGGLDAEWHGRIEAFCDRHGYGPPPSLAALRPAPGATCP